MPKEYFTLSGVKMVPFNSKLEFGRLGGFPDKATDIDYLNKLTNSFIQKSNIPLKENKQRGVI